MTGAADKAPPTYADYRTELFDQGLLVDAGADGIYGLSLAFSDVIAGLESAIQTAGADQSARRLRFPPVVSRRLLERSGYVGSFPNLIGTVRSFDGDDQDHRGMLRRLDAGEDWTDALVETGVGLCSAACHPLYPTLGHSLPAGGLCFDVYGWVYRNEPSEDPARMQAFRQYEYVYVGEAEGAIAHHGLWRERSAALLRGLGLDVHPEIANDPFFGRAGRSLVSSQRTQALKWEMLARTGPVETPTAIASANYHLDHFGVEYEIEVPSGVAHSACVGFGVERIALALFWEHGPDAADWPTMVRDQLGLTAPG